MPAFVLAFGIILLFSPIWAIVQSAFMTRIRNIHPEVREDLGTPDGPFNFSLLDMLRLLGFILRRRYRLLGDRTLKTEGDLLFVVIIVVLSSWVVLMIIPSKTWVTLLP